MYDLPLGKSLLIWTPCGKYFWTSSSLTLGGTITLSPTLNIIIEVFENVKYLKLTFQSTGVAIGKRADSWSESSRRRISL